MTILPMQPRFGEDRYPIGRLVLARAARLGLSRSALVERLGYRGAAGGQRALDRLLQAGISAPLVAKNLAGALELPAEIVNAALATAAAELESEAERQRFGEECAYHAAFRPSLRVLTERAIPEPIFVAVLHSAALRAVPVPDDILALDAAEREALVGTLIRDNYHARQGHIPAFGAITGYVLIVGAGCFVDLGLPYDVDGGRAGPLREFPRLSSGTLRVRGRPLPPSLFRVRDDCF